MTLALSVLAVAGLAYALAALVDAADRAQEEGHRALMRRLREPEAE